jgi:hypothetical protein
MAAIQRESSVARRRRRPSISEVVGAAARGAGPVFDLYLLARLSAQELAEGHSLEDQIREGKRDAAVVLGVDQDRITFVDGDPSSSLGYQGPVVRVSATYISGAAPWERKVGRGLASQSIKPLQNAGVAPRL